MPQSWKEAYKRKQTSFEEAAGLVKSGDFISTALGVGACSPEMYEAILNRHNELEGVRIMDSIQLRPTRLYDPKFMKTLDGRINYVPTFGIQTIRSTYAENNVDYLVNTVVDGGDKSAHFTDIFIAMVTPPNRNGYVNLGLTNDYTMQGIREGRASGKLRLAIGEVNEQMPVIFGDNYLHVSEFDYFIEHNSPIPTFNRNPPTELEDTIARYVLELIEDGDTIQMGIGGIPEAVVAGLSGKHNLGVHTEMFPMGLPNLVEQGVITNACKPIHQGVSIGTFCLGDQAMFDYVAENPACQIYPGKYTNNPALIGQHPDMVAINMALMIDCSGQVVAEGIGHQMISGAGGQIDFALGTYWSKGGKGITLLRSSRRLKDGTLVSNIVPELPLGTPVTVPRPYVHYVITEYGIADLKYKTRRERAQALIAIAHPELRAELQSAVQKNFY